MALAGCNGNNRNARNTGTAGTESGAMSDTTGMSGTGVPSATTGTAADTAAGALRADTAHNGAAGDSAKANQTKSGVTNTKTGKSTLGPGATKTRPDQGQPVTSKGDTISRGVDSVR